MYTYEFMGKIGMMANAEYVLWATSTSSTSMENNYEPLETYGDSILKFASVLLCYEFYS